MYRHTSSVAFYADTPLYRQEKAFKHATPQEGRTFPSHLSSPLCFCVACSDMVLAQPGTAHATPAATPLYPLALWRQLRAKRRMLAPPLLFRRGRLQ